MPTAKGWDAGQTPIAAPGLKVNAFAGDLDHPRWIEVLPNGDVLVAEALSLDRPPRSVFDYAMITTMRRADAMGVSANRITLLRDKDGDGVAETREVFLENQSQPFGMALVDDTFYVGNTRRRGGLSLHGRRQPHHRAGPQDRHVQTRRPLDAKPAAQPRQAKALRRRRLAHQYRRAGHGGGGRPCRHP